MYSDIEKALVGWLGAKLPGVRVLTERPDKMESQLPLVQLSRISGGDYRIRLDRADIDVDVYAASRSVAFVTAEKVREAFRFQLRGQQLDGSVYTRVDTLSGPAWRPYENANVRRFGETFRLTVHHVSA